MNEKITATLIFIGLFSVIAWSVWYTSDNPPAKHNNNSLGIRRVYFDNHSYISNGWFFQKNGITHDPDCPCHRK